MARPARMLKLGVFLNITGHHVAAWWQPQSQADAAINFRHHFARKSRIAQAGKSLHESLRHQGGIMMNTPIVPALRNACFLVLAVLPALVCAQSAYPEKPIRIVNPFPPGSPVEFVGRLVADRLAKAFGKPVLLESRAGAGGTIGANFVAKSAPDGYTLLVTTPSTIAVAPSLYKTLPYDPVKEFAGIWSVMSAGLVVVVNPKVPAANLAEFLVYAKANPGKIAYASSGVGTTQHLAAELFKTRTGLDLLHVPYKGGAPASADLMAGHVQVMFDALSNVRAAVLDGRLRALAVLRGKRARALPEVPTAAESGVNNVEQPGWIGVFAPSGTPADILGKLVAVTVREMSDPDVVAKLMGAGNDNEYVSGPALTKKLADDNLLFAEIVKRAGIQPE